jgi:hypothetical protein
MTDAYTKSVLTIIAGALVVIAVQNAIPEANAQRERPMQVTICDPRGTECAGLPIFRGSIGFASPTIGVTVVNR